MSKASWKDIAELVGIAAIVASLIFVGIQIEQDQELAQVEMRSLFDDRSIALADILTTNKDVWIRGLKGEELTEQNQYVFDSFARVIFIERSNRFSRVRALSDSDGSLLAESFALTLYQYPGLRKFHQEYVDSTRKRFSILGLDPDDVGTFLALVNQSVDRFEREAPSLPPMDFLLN